MDQSAHTTVNVTFVLQNCTVALSVERGFCSETSVQSSDDSNEVITIKVVGEIVRIKEEDEPIAISFFSIKEEPEVSQQTLSSVSVIAICNCAVQSAVCLST
jgi:hypothetical protein